MHVLPGMALTQQITPPFSYRFSQTEIRSSYASASDAFDCGDYMSAAQMATDDELRGCALILSGLVQQGLEQLEKLDSASDRACVCRAAALWIMGRQAEAIAVIKKARDQSPTSKPTAFLKLLLRDEIIAFVTGAILPLHTTDLSFSRDAIQKYGSITVKYVGSQMPENAYDYCPADPIDAFVGGLPDSEKPDFIFALSPQWIVPKNFNKVEVPKVLWAHDGDVFLFRNVDNFSLYDVTICECSQLHFELSRSTPSSCVTNIMFHPLATPFPEAPVAAEKDIDILFTGMSLGQFQSEKPRFIYRLSELGMDYRVQVVDGHLPEKDYFTLVARARFVPLLNRYAGAPSPRWRDSLTSGAGIFYPEGTFYDLIAAGCFPIRDNSMIDDMRVHLERAASGDPAYDNARIASDVNAKLAAYRRPREELFERFLKYAAFMAIVWKGRRAQQPKRDRRLVWLTPRIDCLIFGSDKTLDHLLEIISGIGPDELRDEIDYSNMARLYAQLVYCFGGDNRVLTWYASANRFFAEGLRRFPKSLLLRFNEAHWQFFDGDIGRDKVEEKFREIVDEFKSLHFDFRGSDVGFAFTLGYVDTVFPCYEYGDLVTQQMVLDTSAELRARRMPLPAPRQAILSACHGYIGQLAYKQGKVGDALVRFETALAIFPNNLPLSLVRLELLLDCCEKNKSTNANTVAKLADACFTVANIFPTILLTHAHRFVPVLVRGGEKDAVRTLLAGWYRLQNVIYEPKAGKADYRQITNLATIVRYRRFLPQRLRARLRDARKGDLSRNDLTQIEHILFDLSRVTPANIRRQLRIRLSSINQAAKIRFNPILQAVRKANMITRYLWSDIRNPPSERYSRKHRLIHVALQRGVYIPVRYVVDVYARTAHGRDRTNNRG